MTYSLDALLGTTTADSAPDPHAPSHIFARADPRAHHVPSAAAAAAAADDEAILRQDEAFAVVNGISYTLPTLLSGPPASQHAPHAQRDASTASAPASEAEVAAALADTPWYARFAAKKAALHYVVIYLAPGDYHRFHSPTSWVVEKRRHFAGELYSVSPYLQRTLPGLFTLNERVALLGRWRWGFFSMTPVGATNVGSIIVNFDAELRTNSYVTDTIAARAAAAARAAGQPDPGYAEATYQGASPVLHGQALSRGEEMGGFQLGSTVVLVFEAPCGEGHGRRGGWNWNVGLGQRVKVGESLGWVDEA